MSFKLPDILTKLDCATPRKLYATAWAVSDENGQFQLNADHFKVPARTLYHWASWFVSKAHLWEIVEPGGGRGKKAVYLVKGKADFLKKQAHQEAAENWRQQAQNKPCNEAKDVEKTRKPPFGNPCIGDKNPQRLEWLNDKGKRWAYSFDGWQKLEKGEYGYNKLARCLRYCFWDLGAPRQTNDVLTGIVMNKLEGLSVEQCKDACFKLLRWVSQTLEKFQRLMSRGRAVFSWVAWVLSKFLKGERPEAAKVQQARTPEQKLCTRIHALKSWLVMRESEFETGQACGICKRKHTKVEYRSGYVDDGSGTLNCMGWGRMKFAELEDELHYLRKRKEREEAERYFS